MGCGLPLLFTAMLNTLYARLAAGLILLLAVVGLLYTGITRYATEHYLQEISHNLNRDLAKNLVADRNLVAAGKLDEAALKETFRQYMVINPSIEIYLLDLEGRILSFSANPGKVKRRRVALEPIQTFLHAPQRTPLLGDDPRSHDRRKAFSVTPVPTAENPQGYLYVVLRGEEFDQIEQAAREGLFRRINGWAFAVSLLFGLVTGLIVFRGLTRRLHRLSSLMQAFHENGFRAHTPYQPEERTPVDEIDRLGLTFDKMARRIETQIEQLEAQDGLRRDLVARVSHDLRTPLASLQGYLESLEMRHDSLSPEQRDEYIRIALRQSRRLAQRIDELFELARLDAQETRPRREPFPPAELIQDVVQKYRLRAEQQGIRLIADPGNNTLPFVLADIALTERVVENLLDNAFAHTPAGSRIEVRIATTREHARISVSNDGAGIDKNDLPHLFEPFYRAANGSDER
ncbi:MAG TPA: HAMP domain-containing histidine kinase, partial [Chromatiales bacterium]|nr:HAMP domain-containing histidine kinase [Chromatiales bacterium]